MAISETERTNNNMSSPTDAKETTSQFSAQWTALVNRLRQPILRGLLGITHYSANYPKTTIATTSLLSLLLISLGLLTNFSINVNVETVFTPVGSKPSLHSQWIDDQAGFPGSERLTVFVVHGDGQNVLNKPAVDGIFKAMDAVLALPNYDAICAESDTKDGVLGDPYCDWNGVVDFWESSSETYYQQAPTPEDVIAQMSATTFPGGVPVADNLAFGHAQHNADTNLLEFVESYTLSLHLPDTNAAYEFEDLLLTAILEIDMDWQDDPTTNLRIAVNAPRTFEDEALRALEADLPLIPLVFVVMSIFTCAVFSERHKVQSRSLLGFSAVFCVLMSLLASYGLLFCIGIPLTSLTQVLPFVIFGIGLDDAFIIVGEYRRTCVTDSLPKRIQDTIRHVGLSIAMTSVTSAVAFGLGGLSSVRAARWMALYGFPAIIFNFLYQITFFVACMVLDERRIQQNRRDCCVWITVPGGPNALVDTESSSGGSSTGDGSSRAMSSNGSVGGDTRDDMMLTEGGILSERVTTILSQTASEGPARSPKRKRQTDKTKGKVESTGICCGLPLALGDTDEEAKSKSLDKIAALSSEDDTESDDFVPVHGPAPSGIYYRDEALQGKSTGEDAQKATKVSARAPSDIYYRDEALNGVDQSQRAASKATSSSRKLKTSSPPRSRKMPSPQDIQWIEDDGEESIDIFAGKHRGRQNTSPSSVKPRSTEHVADRFMTWYAQQLLRPAVKLVVVVAFLSLFACCSLSATKLTQEFKYTDLVPTDSYLTEYSEVLRDHTTGSSVLAGVYFRNVDQSDPMIQEQMDEYMTDLVTIPAIRDPPEFCWLWHFRQFVDAIEDAQSLSFEDQIELFLAQDVFYRLYSKDIARNSAGNVTATRCNIPMNNFDFNDVNDQVATLLDQRAVTMAQPINVGKKDWSFFSYVEFYDAWEFYAIVNDELAMVTLIGVTSVAGIALLFVPHWSAVFFVFPMIAMLYVDLLGVMQWFGIHVNVTSYVVLSMAIGLLVDFIMHVLLSYYEAEGDRRQKSVAMLSTMGASILLGGISTFLGTLPLAFSTSEVIRTIFIVFVALVSLGLAHGLIFLPVVLAHIGPEDKINSPSVAFKETEGAAPTTDMSAIQSPAQEELEV